jgi:hypothetical protein
VVVVDPVVFVPVHVLVLGVLVLAQAVGDNILIGSIIP